MEFEVVVPGVEELTGGDPVVEVVENARMKARAVERDELVVACREGRLIPPLRSSPPPAWLGQARGAGPKPSSKPRNQ